MSETEELIFTSKGMLPAKDLRYETLWIDGMTFEVALQLVKQENGDMGFSPKIEKRGFLRFVERYYLGDEVVKESAHVYFPGGIESNAEQGTFG